MLVGNSLKMCVGFEISLTLLIIIIEIKLLLISRSRVQPSSACSTCYCQICGEDSATNTCYSCSSSMYSGGSVLERKSSIKSISRIGDRTLALIDTDSESSLESFGSIDSPKTAWKNANRNTVSQKKPLKINKTFRYII